MFSSLLFTKTNNKFSNYAIDSTYSFLKKKEEMNSDKSHNLKINEILLNALKGQDSKEPSKDLIKFTPFYFVSFLSITGVICYFYCKK